MLRVPTVVGILQFSSCKSEKNHLSPAELCSIGKARQNTVREVEKKTKSDKIERVK